MNTLESLKYSLLCEIRTLENISDSSLGPHIMNHLIQQRDRLAAIQMLERDNASFRKALKPFAAKAKKIREQKARDGWVDMLYDVPLSDLNAAASALEGAST